MLAPDPYLSPKSSLPPFPLALWAHPLDLSQDKPHASDACRLLPAVAAS
jgi:hypothetical protein